MLAKSKLTLNPLDLGPITMTTAQMIDQLPSSNHPYALTALYEAAVINDLPIAIWRYANDQTYHAIVDLSGQATTHRIDLSHLPAGFVFSPFVNQGEEGMLFIKADIYFSADGFQIDGDHAENPLNETIRANRHLFFDTYHTRMARYDLDCPTWCVPNANNDLTLDEYSFCGLVSSAIDYLKSSDLEKIVVSRIAEHPLPDAFHPVETVMRLSERYSHAFISLVSIPEVGTWIGATPERLLTMEEGTLTTVALAGTQAKPAHLALNQIAWGEKEIREQALVSDYIRAFFQKVGTAWQEDGPHTVAAGNVVHLQTAFRAQVDTTEQVELVNQVFEHLHPTSAVCGMPKEQALDFILEHEMYDRSFYSGFLGPIHLHGLCQLFVNLRCMRLSEDTACLYVGAGITAESDPHAEWQETVLKSQTLLSVLNSTDQDTIQCVNRPNSFLEMVK